MERESNELLEYFSSLAERQRKENDISDFLWAMFKNSKEFREKFFGLVKEQKENHDLKIKDFPFDTFEYAQREVSEDKNRYDIDLCFESNKKIIIEVKKYSRIGEDQLKNYTTGKDPNTEFLLLSYHNEKPSIDEHNKNNAKKWGYLNWKILIKKLESHTGNDLIINCFTTYLKGVFYMTNIKPVKNFIIPELLYLNLMVKISIEENPDICMTKNSVSGHKQFDFDGSGYYFNHTIKASGEEIKPWVGINYNDEKKSENPFGLMFWLNEYHKNTNVFRILSSKGESYLKPKFETVADKARLDRDTVVIYQDWSEEGNSRFRADFLSKKNNVEEQIAVIQNFIKTILATIEEIVKSK